MVSQLDRVDDGADVDGLVERVADAEAVHPAFELVVEAGGDAFLHEEARAGAADLALVEPDRIDEAFDGGVEVGVVEDDVGGFAAELQGEGFAGAGGRLADALADGGGAGEGDLVDGGVDERGAGGAVAGDDVEDALGEARLAADLGEEEGGEGGVFGGFEDDGVPGGEGGGDLPGEHQEREVPGDDRAADAEAVRSGCSEGRSWARPAW